MRKGALLGGTVLALVLAGSMRPAGAEWFLDLYGGGAFTQDADITIHDGTPLNAKLKFDTEVTGGGRVGYWLAGVGLPWLGFAVDVSYYAPETSAADVDARLEVVPISALVLLRVPLLADPEVPTGRVQPYVGGGPSLVATRVKLDAPVIGERFSETVAELGADFRAGITFMLTRNFGVFAEGRYLFFTTKPGAANFGVDIDIETFQALGGVTLRF
jgi:Outer membrane protein beta-barrel domain